jgi:hypothetical protein
MAEQKSSYIGSRLAATSPFLTPPGPLGFSSLIEPDSAFGDPTFNANWHFNAAAREAMIQRVAMNALAVLWPKFQEEVRKKADEMKPAEGKRLLGQLAKWSEPDAAEWFDGATHTVEIDEENPGRIKITDPYIRFKNRAHYTQKGEVHTKTMRGSDAQGAPIDLAEANPAPGSIVQMILQPQIFISGTVKVPTLTFGLQGLRILKLESWGRRGGGLGAVSQEDLALLGETFHTEDLSRYARAKPAAAAVATAPAESIHGEQYGHDEDPDDEVPF